MLCTFINFIGIGKSCLATAHSKTKPLGGRDRENMIVKSIFSFIFYSVFLCVVLFLFYFGWVFHQCEYNRENGERTMWMRIMWIEFHNIFKVYKRQCQQRRRSKPIWKEKKPQHNRKTQSDDETKKNYNNPPKYEC